MLSTDVRSTTSAKGKHNGGSGSTPKVKNDPMAPSRKGSSSNLNQSPVQILEDPNGSKKTVECDSSAPSRETNEGVVMTYDLTGVKCVGVRYGGKEVWKRDASDPNAPYPVSTFFVIKGGMAFVVFKESMNVYKLQNDEWKTVFSGKPKPLVLDSRSKSSNDFCDYSNDGKVHTFTVKDKHLFSGFIKSGRCLQPDTPIWTPGVSDEFATKIVYNKTDGNNYILEIYQINGLIRKFVKASKTCRSGTWKQHGVTHPGTELVPEKIQILTERQSTAQQSSTETPKTTVSTPVTSKSAGLSTESGTSLSSDADFEEDTYLKYAFDYGVKCTSVRYDGKSVWKRDASKPENPYPVSVVFAVKGATAFVNFIGYRMILRLENGQWKTIFSGTEDLDFVNIQCKKACDNYDCEVSDKVYTYTSKSEVLFNKVVSQVGNGKEEIIFETLAILDVVNKIVYDESDPKNLVITIQHVDGVTRKLVKSRGAKWKEFSATDSGFELDERKVEFVIQCQHAIQKPKKPDDQSTQGTDVSEGQVEKQEPDSDTVNRDKVSLAPGTYDTLPSGRTRVDLDIRTRTSTEQFDYSQSIRFWTYEAKDGFYFGSVKDGSTIIYKRSTAGSPVRVIAEVDASSTLIGLTLNIISKEIKRFKVSDGNLHGKA